MPDVQDTPPDRGFALPARELIFLTFRVGPVQMALPVQRLREVLRYRPARPVPYAPPFIEGIIHLRGELIPILDLRKRFRYPEAVSTKTRTLLTWIYDHLIGLTVDEAESIIHVRPAQIRSVPPLPDTALEEFIIGAIVPESESEQVYLLPDFDMLLRPGEREAWRRWEPPGTDEADDPDSAAEATTRAKG